MCAIDVHLRIQCSDQFSEVPVHNLVQTELAVESVVSTALLELFDTVFVQAVRVQHSEEDNNADGIRCESNLESER